MSLEQHRARIILESYKTTDSESIEKGASANIGEIREWGGKKYKKTFNGWAQLSDAGQHRDHHRLKANEIQHKLNKLADNGEVGSEEYKKLSSERQEHISHYEKTSGKNHDDKQVGIKKEKKGPNQEIQKSEEGEEETEMMTKSEALEILGLSNDSNLDEILEKGKKANIGEIREWQGGKYQKTAKGWDRQYSEGSKKGKKTEEKKEHSQEDLFNIFINDEAMDKDSAEWINENKSKLTFKVEEKGGVKMLVMNHSGDFAGAIKYDPNQKPPKTEKWKKVESKENDDKNRLGTHKATREFIFPATTGGSLTSNKGQKDTPIRVNVGDDITIDVQHGSLGSAWKLKNHSTGESDSYMGYEYNPSWKNNVENIKTK